MILDELCPPAILYVAFSLTHIVIDLFKNLYNTAFLKFVVMIIFTLLLNILCQQGLDVVSWFIVFVPFIMMTVITSVLLFMFGLSPSKGNLKYNVQYPNRGKHGRGRGKHGRGKHSLSKSERRRMRRREKRRERQDREPSAHQNDGHHSHSQHPDVYEDNYKPSYKKYHRQHGKYYNDMPYDENGKIDKHHRHHRHHKWKDSEYNDDSADWEWNSGNKYKPGEHRPDHHRPRHHKGRGKGGHHGQGHHGSGHHGQGHRPRHPKCKTKQCNSYMDCDNGDGYCNNCGNGISCCGPKGGNAGCE